MVRLTTLSPAYVLPLVGIISFFSVHIAIKVEKYAMSPYLLDYAPLPAGFITSTDDMHDGKGQVTDETLPVPKSSEYGLARNNTIWFAGIMLNASEIKPAIFQYMVELNCKLQISIHIVAGTGIDKCLAKYRDELESKSYQKEHCAEFHVEAEPGDTAAMPNRIDRISHVRDFQRGKLRDLFGVVQKDDIVIIADIDLYRLPTFDSLFEQLEQMTEKHEHDVICSAGLMHRPYGYYDTFATVLFPDTFIYPYRGRHIRTPHEGEDPSLVRSDHIYGVFTQWDILEYFENGGQRSKKIKKGSDGDSSLAVPVKSCFGGLTIYSAPKWLETQCHYKMNVTGFMRYASKRSQFPCEHVIFHSCLIENDPSTSIAVHPNLRTEWDKDEPFGSSLKPEKIHFTLGTYANQGDRGDRLVNGQYTLRINQEGNLVTERWNGGSSVAIWTADIIPKRFVDIWTHMYLILKSEGVLDLVQQVPMSKLKRIHPSPCNSKKDGDICKCDPKTDNCSITVWSSGKVKTPSKTGKKNRMC
mmetsp:Transcript_38140/g.56207  ORF Transcript_38140/g.56207 Transcript_38140/m.56207 type:complete len:527 (+) Transcript_38140:106-1686(+)